MMVMLRAVIYIAACLCNTINLSLDINNSIVSHGLAQAMAHDHRSYHIKIFIRRDACHRVLITGMFSILSNLVYLLGYAGVMSH